MLSLHSAWEAADLQILSAGCRKIVLYSFLLSYIPKHSRSAHTQATMKFGFSFKSSTQIRNIITYLL